MHLGRAPAERGQSIVELALTLPVLALLCMGILDFGRVFYAYETVVNASREGARYCARNPGGGALAGTVADEVSGRVTIAGVVSRQEFPGFIGAYQSGCAPGGSGDDVRVRVSTAFRPITPLIDRLLATPVGANDPCPGRPTTDLCVVASATFQLAE
jgi:Flp pilus assembly protein TadG